MVSKKGKQLMIKENSNFNIISGTVDNKKPKSLYINISAWAEPLINDELNYKNIIREINKKIKTELHSKLDSNVFKENKNMIDFDMRESGISFGKRSYMSCEITLFQIHSFKIQEKIIQDSLNELSKKQLITEIELDFKKGYEGILKLPKDAKFGVFIAYRYYKQLLKKIANTPANEIKSTRIRVADYKKIELLTRSYVKFQLNLL